MEYVTVPDVELVTAGISWPGAGGNDPEGTSTITLEHLVDFMVAGNDDPLIRPPRVKLGHARLQPTEDGFTTLGDHDPYWDGTPCFGTVRNMRLTNDGGRLIGDLVDVPEWLRDAMPTHWPSRSIEWRWNVNTEGGKHYTVVMTAVSLLGVVEHAVKNLADVRRLLDGTVTG